MNKVKSYVILLASLFLCSRLLANEGITRDNLLDISSKWTYKCSSKVNKDPRRLEFLKELSEEAFIKGMLELQKINPKFTNQLLETAKNNSMTIKCKQKISGGAEASSLTYGFSKIFGGSISVGSYVLSEYINRKHLEEENEDLKELMAHREELTEDEFQFELKRTLSLLDAFSSNQLQYKLFHELLHFMGADNLSMHVHNNPKANRVNDIVFSCSEFAWFKSMDSCLTCAKANGIGDDTLLENSKESSEKVNKLCREYSDPESVDF